MIATLQQLPVSSCTYDEWLHIGMGLKAEGYRVTDWELWSALDTQGRYHAGECERKWRGFNRTGITGGTLVEICRQHGVEPVRNSTEPETRLCDHDRGRALSWDSEISAEEPEQDGDAGQTAERHAKELVTFIDAAFQRDEIIGYVTTSREINGRIAPEAGISNRTAGEIMDGLRDALEAGEANPVEKVLGAVRFNQKADDTGGAWVRVNPLDGHGIKDENVTAFRHVLIESDTMPLPEQESKIRELQLPVTTLTYSGGKSLHALVRVDAENVEQYRERVRFLYRYCSEHGFGIDEADKNPSRLSRLPGFTRAGKSQRLLGVRMGRESWAAWRLWATMADDGLPEIESLADVWESPPELAPPLIDGLLRQGHKMIISAPSKAGKSFLLIELAVCIAEGHSWLGFPCRKGRVLYINAEIDRASCWDRVLKVYRALGLKTPDATPGNLDVFNLRGHAAAIKTLTSKIIQKARQGGYSLLIFDPAYKLLGNADENAAGDVGQFWNELDRIATALGASVAVTHHYAKGYAGTKRSIDRASGSGVFARDPDAILTLTELHKDDSVCTWIDDYAQGCAAREVLSSYLPDWQQRVEGEPTGEQLYHWAEMALPEQGMELMNALTGQLSRLEDATAWRVEFILREFRTPPRVDNVFCYPLHVVDDSGTLGRCEFERGQEQAEAAAAQRQEEKEKRAADREQKKRSDENDVIKELFSAVEAADGGTTLKALTTEGQRRGKDVDEQKFRRWIDRSSEFCRLNGRVYRQGESGAIIRSVPTETA